MTCTPPLLMGSQEKGGESGHLGHADGPQVLEGCLPHLPQKWQGGHSRGPTARDSHILVKCLEMGLWRRITCSTFKDKITLGGRLTLDLQLKGRKVCF